MSATAAAVWACMLNLLFIAALPRVFFRRGRLNARWWLNAAPFAVAGIGLLLELGSAMGDADAGTVHAALALSAVAIASCSIALIAYAVGSHRVPVSLWHQQDDAPAAIVCHGAYARVRHPFYVAFLLALLACGLAAPGPFTAVAFMSAVILLQWTARQEEARLLASAAGSEYAAYMARTGRFLPWPDARGSTARPAAAARHASSRPPART
ncbi:MAG TPA: hypothetical protein VK929_01925 [Longimicrobiales bacterium]|nr:hypothetical protein [Longimicrobiales bacterium]